jgi:IS30 family transposase
MGKIGRPGLSDEQKRDVWRRWKEGCSLSDIARALGKVPGSIHGVVAANGGFAPPERRRAAQQLSLVEREEISRGLAARESYRLIGTRLGRPASTVSREIDRNGGRAGYRAARAEERAWEQARRPKACVLAGNAELADLVAGKLADDWSPEQIAGWLARTNRRDEGLYVSHETIYRSLFIQARGVLKKELTKHLRTRRMMRRSAKASTAGQSRGQIRDAVPISQRPAEAADRAVPGSWEGDLVIGTKDSQIATLVERRSRYLMLVRVPGKDAPTVATCLTRQVKRLPEQMMRSLTWDRGTELAEHKRFSIATDVAVYFADPHSPWQRGTNENTNRLLRQYFPKSTDLSGYTQADLDAVAAKLNTRPRKTLDFRTPADTLADSVAPTG